MTTQLSHLGALEAESIHIFREVAAEFEKPVLLFSGGKDSAVMLRLAEKAFWPARIPFPVMHVDTGHNFDEVLDYRDRRIAELEIQMVVASVQESIDSGRVVEETGPKASRNRLQTITLLDAITENGFDAVFGGGRRDEEKARAKERVYSFRDDFGQWDPKNQRPEVWNLYNGKHRKGEHIRVFPLSNWTELDIWQYIAEDGVELPSIYYAHRRQVFRRDGMLLAVTPFVTVMDGEEPEEMLVRYRTVGDASCTGAVESSATTVEEVIAEVAAARITERGATRADDRFTEAAMEDRKREGYFWNGTVAVRDRGLGRRRQEHAHRAAAARDEADLRGPARGRRAHEPRKGFDYTNLALLTDGLRAEREQGITIDVAYRYFATPKRKFIIADTPGHMQYTRNMVTGASTADLALVLIDARKGVLEQSRRHAVIASLLQVKHLVLCVNKMDLVDFDEGRFDEICAEFTDFAAKLDIDDLTFIPISALHGDNVVQHSPNTPWYEGPTLLHHLEHVYIGSDRNLIDARFPVQYVIRPMSHDHHDYRGYAGQVASGMFRPGDEVLVLPSGFTTTIEGIDCDGGEVDEAYPPMSVSIRLADDLDVSRGDMICRPNNAPTATQDIDAMICWFNERRCAKARSTASSTRRAQRAPVSRTCTTASTSTRCTATTTRARSR